MDNELNNIVSSEYFYLETDMAFMRRKALSLISSSLFLWKREQRGWQWVMTSIT